MENLVSRRAYDASFDFSIRARLIIGILSGLFGGLFFGLFFTLVFKWVVSPAFPSPVPIFDVQMAMSVGIPFGIVMSLCMALMWPAMFRKGMASFMDSVYANDPKIIEFPASIEEFSHRLPCSWMKGHKWHSRHFLSEGGLQSMSLYIQVGNASVRQLCETSSLKSRLFVCLLSVLSFLAAVAAFGPTARAATINVNGFGDTLGNNGVCTIREAIINANNNAATWSDCTGGLGADVINLPAGTITFSIPNTPSSFSAEELTVKGDLDIRGSLTINGNPDGTTINGAALDRIFDINPDPDGDPSTPTPAITVHINNLTITNGRQNDVGAVRVQPNATVTIGHCTISNSVSWANDAGGIGVLNGATLTMTNSTVTGNTALLLDGGIKNEGNLHLNSCTITRNTGVHNRAQGLGCNGPVCNVRNTIIAGNGINRADTEGNVTSLGYNVIGKLTDDLGNLITIVTATTGDQFGVTSAQIKLGVLGPNGGPTRTHELLPGSVAIDKGKSDGLATDQRLLKRPCDNPAIANAVGGDGADIGAFEVQGCVPQDECCCRRVKGRLVGTCCPKPTRLLRL